MRKKKTLSQLRQSYQWGSKINLLGGRLYSPWVSEYQHPIGPICIRVRESWLTVVSLETVAIGIAPRVDAVVVDDRVQSKALPERRVGRPRQLPGR